MKKIIKEFLTYQKSERNGIIILFFILLFLIIIPQFYEYVIPKERTDFTAFEIEIKIFLSDQTNKSSNKNYNNSSADTTLVVPLKNNKLFEFDPNSLTIEKWKELGINDFTISNIQKFVSKGGKFYQKDDFKKIYGLTNDEYVRLEPFIVFPKTDNLKKTAYKNNTSETVPIIDLNTADSTALIALNGIGPKLSSRIIKYRNALGGFISKEQLLEVYGVDSTLYYSIFNFISISDIAINKINVNITNDTILFKHPYINYKVAKAIINYRNQHGHYAALTDLKKSHLINEEIFNKISPYLTL